jgi:glycosyltransferase involved in cell wall biosynthesis
MGGNVTAAPGTPHVDVSIIVPVMNEEDTLRDLYQAILGALESSGRSFEIVFVDDGSSDGSYAAISDLHRQDARVKAVRLRRNYGKSTALAAGLARISGDAVVTIDADLQDDPSEIPALLARLEGGLDLVTGWRKDRHDPAAKTLPSWIFNRATSRLTGIRVHDFNCGLKAMTRAVADDLELYGELHRFIPVLAAWRGFRVGEEVVRHQPRRHGASKYGFERMTSFLDLITVMFLTRFRKKPSHVFGAMGTLCFCAGLAVNLYLTFLKISGGYIAPRYPLLGLGILLLVVGVQLVCFGLLGEMITQTHQKDRRDYSVRETLG